MAIPPLTQLKAVIFDFDGVIVDSERVKFDSLKPILREYGITLHDREYRYKVGRKTLDFLRDRFGKKLSRAQINAIADRRRAGQMRQLSQYAKPISGVKSLIRTLQRKRLKLCIATGSMRHVVLPLLRAIDLRKEFPILVTGEEYHGSKPDPLVYRIALRKLKLKPQQVLVIEDAPAGIIAAKRAGIAVVGIATTHTRSELKNADLVVGSFAELRRKLR